jgi:hypothetical protein
MMTVMVAEALELKPTRPSLACATVGRARPNIRPAIVFAVFTFNASLRRASDRHHPPRNGFGVWLMGC